MRYAGVHIGASNPSTLVQTIKRYMPENYEAIWVIGSEIIFIYGRDVAGWTLDDYVIPRLASGGYIAKEMK